MSTALVLFAASLAPACAQTNAVAVSDALALEATIPLPDVEGRIDHLTLDERRGRLFVAARGNDSVEVLDLAAGTLERRLTGLGEPQGILFLAKEDRLVVASGADGSCGVFDGATLERVAEVDVGGDADNLRYSAASGRVVVGYGDGALALIDPATWSVVGRVPLDGHPEAFQLDAEGKRAWVNVPGARQVARVDLASQSIGARWKLAEAGSNFPLALLPRAAGGAPALLVGCRAPATLLVRDADDGKALQALELSGDVDDLFFDAKRRRVYAACGAGYLDVFAVGETELLPRTRLATAPGARTCLFAPERDALYLAVPRRGAQVAEVRVYRPRDGSPVDR